MSSTTDGECGDHQRNPGQSEESFLINLGADNQMEEDEIMLTARRGEFQKISEVLNEKEKDLELAAKIGKSLLDRNHELQKTNEFLEDQLNAAKEQVTQLKHDLQTKVDLVQLFTDLDSESGGSTPSSERLHNWNLLQKKLYLLEHENLCLKLEAGHLKSLTANLEEKEQTLLNDCVKQLAAANDEVNRLSQELYEKSVHCDSHDKQIEHLHKDLNEKVVTVKKLCCQNEEVQIHLQAAQETQMELAHELADLQERYAEVVALLAETKEELKRFKDHDPFIFRRSNSTGPDSAYDSLASEIEATESPVIRKYTDKNTRKIAANISNVAQLMQNIKTDYSKCLEDNSFSKPLEENSYRKTSTPVKMDVKTVEGDKEEDDNEDGYFGGWKAKQIFKDIESSLFGSPLLKKKNSKDSLFNYKSNGIGVPGIPGSKDLEHAIKRLSLRRRVELEFQKYRQEKVLTASTTAESFSADNVSEPDDTYSMKSSTSKSKLILVKPMEGSEILSHWQELAKPSMATAFDRRPGIKVKTGSPPMSVSNNAEYHLHDGRMQIRNHGGGGMDSGVCSDAEQSSSSNVGRQNYSTPGTFSFVDSQVLQPAVDGCNVSGYLKSAIPASSGPSSSATALNLAQTIRNNCLGLLSAGTIVDGAASLRSTSTKDKTTSSDKLSGLESVLDENDFMSQLSHNNSIITRASIRKAKFKE